MVYALIAVLIVTVLSLLAAAVWLARRWSRRRGLCRIEINGGEKVLHSPKGQTLLAALKSHSIFLPSACGGRGICGYCKCKVTGGGELAEVERTLLTPQQIEDHFRIACQLQLQGDVSIQVSPKLLAVTQYRGVVERIRDLTHDMKELRIRLIHPATINFTAGQYVQLETPPYGKSRERVLRAYSISNPPHEKDHVELIIRMVPAGICTTWVFTVLKEGDEVTFNGPFGSFRLSRGEREMLWIAGGSGMAPFWGMLRHMKQANIRRKCTYFFGAMTERDLVFQEELRQAEKELDWFTFVPALSSPEIENGWRGERGLITEVLDRHVAKGTLAEAYLCGSGGMIDAAARVLRIKGMPENHIFYDKFT